MTTSSEVYDMSNEDGYEGQRVMDAVLMLVIYILFPALFWGLILWLIF